MTYEQDLVPYLRLKLNINYSDYEAVWMEGYSASQNNLTDASNPYHQDSREHNYWQEGWWSAFYGEEPIFDIHLDTIKDVVIENAATVAANDSYDDALANNITALHEGSADPKAHHWYYRSFNLLLAIFAIGASYNLYDMAS